MCLRTRGALPPIPLYLSFYFRVFLFSRFQWLRDLRRRSEVARLLGLWVRISPGHGCVSVVFCVLSGRGLCVGPITRPGESCGVSTCVCVCVCVCVIEYGQVQQ